MSIETRSQSAAEAARAEFEHLHVPDASSVVERSRRRRRTRRNVGGMVVVVGLIVVIAGGLLLRKTASDNQPRRQSPPTITLFPRPTKHYEYGGVDFAYRIRPYQDVGYCLEVSSDLGASSNCGARPIANGVDVISLGGTVPGAPVDNVFLAAVAPNVTRVELGENGSVAVKPPDPGDDLTFIAYPISVLPFEFQAFDATGTLIGTRRIEGRPPISESCNATREHVVAKGTVDGHAWSYTVSGSTRNRSIVAITYIDGASHQSSCTDADSWRSLIRRGPTGWDVSQSQPGSPRPINIVAGQVPPNARTVRVELDGGERIELNTTRADLDVPVRFFATAIPGTRTVVDITAHNSRGQAVMVSKRHPDDGLGATFPFEPGVRLSGEVVPSRVPLPLK